MTTAQAIIASAIAIVAIYGLWRAQAWPRKPKAPTGPIAIEDGPIELVLQPWSPTRGHYTFAVADLPEPYQTLQGIEGTTHVTQFGDDADDARAKLLQMILRKKVEGVGLNGFEHQITAEPTKFKPLLKRKGQ